MKASALNLATRPQAWRPYLVPLLLAGATLGTATASALATRGTEGFGPLNAFVESLSGGSSSFLGGAATFLPLGFAFGAGMVSAVNPCGFAMLPAYLGIYLGANERDGASGGRGSQRERVARAFVVGGTVTAGFVALFGIAGVTIGAGAFFVADAFPYIGLSVGVLLTIAGAWILSDGKIYSGLAARAASHIGNPAEIGTRGYFLFGLSYGTASLSCTLPVFLAVIGGTFTLGGLPNALAQFVLYALGMGLVIIILTLAMALFKGAFVGALRRLLPYFSAVSAGLMLIAGAYITFYWLTVGGLLA